MDSPHPTRAAPNVPEGSISGGCGRSRRAGEVGDVAGTPATAGSSVLASRTRGCSGSEDVLEDRHAALDHRLEESDWLYSFVQGVMAVRGPPSSAVRRWADPGSTAGPAMASRDDRTNTPARGGIVREA